MTRKIVVRTTARLDVVRHGEFISQDNLTAAIRFLEAFDETLNDLLAMPGLGSPWETKNPRFQGLVSGRFRDFQDT